MVIKISRDNSNIRTFLLVILIVGIVGAITLILLINPGGFQIFEIGVYISDFFQILTILAFQMGIIIIIVFFIYSVVLSVVSVTDLKYLKPFRNYKLGMIFMAINFIATLLLFIMIIIATIFTTYLWILPAIFTGISCACSMLNFVLYLNIIKFLKKDR
jgi:hypothetical protein